MGAGAAAPIPHGGHAPVRFPTELWNDPADCALAEQLAQAFDAGPLLLTDKLTNTIFVNEAAEALYGERAEAIVNRVAASLLGFGEKANHPDRLVAALLGEAAPWKGAVRVEAVAGARLVYVEASAVRRGEQLVCGVVRLVPQAEAGA